MFVVSLNSVFLFSRKLELKRSIICVEIPTAFVAADHLYIYIYIYTLRHTKGLKQVCLNKYLNKFYIKFQLKKV